MLGGPPEVFDGGGDEGEETGGKLVTAQFVRKLYQMVTTEDQALISFVPDGTAFQVHDPKRFEAEVLPKFFRHSRFSSFVRQLNFYSFSKISRERNTWIYKHDRFLREHPELLETVRRKSSGSGKASPQPPKRQVTPQQAEGVPAAIAASSSLSIAEQVYQMGFSGSSSSSSSDHWTQHQDGSSGRVYYFNQSTGESRWELPDSISSYPSSAQWPSGADIQKQAGSIDSVESEGQTTRAASELSSLSEAWSLAMVGSSLGGSMAGTGSSSDFPVFGRPHFSVQEGEQGVGDQAAGAQGAQWAAGGGSGVPPAQQQQQQQQQQQVAEEPRVVQQPLEMLPPPPGAMEQQMQAMQMGPPPPQAPLPPVHVLQSHMLQPHVPMDQQGPLEQLAQAAHQRIQQQQPGPLPQHLQVGHPVQAPAAQPSEHVQLQQQQHQPPPAQHVPMDQQAHAPGPGLGVAPPPAPLQAPPSLMSIPPTDQHTPMEQQLPHAHAYVAAAMEAGSGVGGPSAGGVLLLSAAAPMEVQAPPPPPLAFAAVMDVESKPLPLPTSEGGAGGPPPEGDVVGGFFLPPPALAVPQQAMSSREVRAKKEEGLQEVTQEEAEAAEWASGVGVSIAFDPVVESTDQPPPSLVPTGSSGATSTSSVSASESLSTSDWERLLALAQQHPTLLSSPHAQALRPATRELLAFCLQTCPFQPADELYVALTNALPGSPHLSHEFQVYSEGQGGGSWGRTTINFVEGGLNASLEALGAMGNAEPLVEVVHVCRRLWAAVGVGAR